MPFFQVPVTPLPTGVDLSNKVAIVTGANTGIGYESARQLLVLKTTTVILAVRNVSKGEEARKNLLSDPIIKKHNPSATVNVMKLDLDNYDSVIAFANAVQSELPALHLLLLNAGSGLIKYTQSASGHEYNLQINYLSNVLLTLKLLPMLEAAAEKTGEPSRLSWVGSRFHAKTTLADKKPIKPGHGVIEHFDDKKNFTGYFSYPDTKCLCAMFVETIAEHVPKEKVIINTVCPGMVNTSMSDVLPFYLRVPMNLVKSIRARSPEEASWIVVNALVVAGQDSHGRFLGDKTIIPTCDFIKSAAGRDVQRRLWEETVAEMKRVDASALAGIAA